MKKIILLVSGVCVLVVIVVFVFFKYCKNDRHVWINLNKVHGDFIYKKELEEKLIKTTTARKTIIDSMEFELQVLSKQIKAEKARDKNKISVYQVKLENYYTKKKELEENNAVMQQQYNEQIITQINQYMKDFGNEKGYDFIFGTDGSGVLMYANESLDVTKEAITYINEKYKGKTE